MTTDENHTDSTQPSVDDQLNDVLTKLTEHANEITRVLHDIRGNEYGTWNTEVNGNEWTIKHENGDVEWLRQTTDDEERYVISARDTPTPDTVATALQDYPEFVDAFNSWVDNINDTITAAENTLNTVEAVNSDMVIEQRDDLADDAWDAAHDIAEDIQTVTGRDYGKFKTEINGNEWLMKYHKNGRAKYLKIGSTYVLGDNDPHPKNLALLTENFDKFVESVNDWLDQQESNTAFNINIEQTTPDETGSDRDGDD